MRRTAEEKAEQIMSNVMIWESEDCGAGIDNREEVEAMIASAIREAEREALEAAAKVVDPYKVCTGSADGLAEEIADKIRALKDEP